jgi:hypothetical protein
VVCEAAERKLHVALGGLTEATYKGLFQWKLVPAQRVGIDGKGSIRGR